MRSTKLLLAGANAAVILLTFSCARSTEEGPLAWPDEGLVWCAPTSLYPAVALGMPLDFTEGSDIHVIEVTATNAVGIKIGDLFLMNVSPDWRLSLSKFPPEEDFPAQWASAMPAHSRSVSAGSHVDLVVQIEASSGRGGSFDELTIHYSQDGNKYEASSHIGLTLSPTTCK